MIQSYFIIMMIYLRFNSLQSVKKFKLIIKSRFLHPYISNASSSACFLGSFFLKTGAKCSWVNVRDVSTELRLSTKAWSASSPLAASGSGKFSFVPVLVSISWKILYFLLRRMLYTINLFFILIYS